MSPYNTDDHICLMCTERFQRNFGSRVVVTQFPNSQKTDFEYTLTFNLLSYHLALVKVKIRSAF